LTTEKPYKISYKLYYNTRLKPVLFHGKEIYPLYVQLTFDRQSIYFKSYYFDLLSAPKYAIRHYTGSKYPGIKEVEEKEERLIEFILQKYSDAFSLELFKEKYVYYSSDLLSLLDEEFKDYLFTFLNDEGDDFLAMMVKRVSDLEAGIRITEGLQRPLKPNLYQKMMEYAVYYVPGYLPVTTLQGKKGDRLLTFSIFEWELPENKEALNKILAHSFPNYKPDDVVTHINKMVRRALSRLQA
jgi:hypothetical protein